MPNGAQPYRVCAGRIDTSEACRLLRAAHARCRRCRCSAGAATASLTYRCQLADRSKRASFVSPHVGVMRIAAVRDMTPAKSLRPSARQGVGGGVDCRCDTSIRRPALGRARPSVQPPRRGLSPAGRCRRRHRRLRSRDQDRPEKDRESLGRGLAYLEKRDTDHAIRDFTAGVRRSSAPCRRDPNRAQAYRRRRRSQDVRSRL